MPTMTLGVWTFLAFTVYMERMNEVVANEKRPLRSGKRRTTCKMGETYRAVGLAILTGRGATLVSSLKFWTYWIGEVRDFSTSDIEGLGAVGIYLEGGERGTLKGAKRHIELFIHPGKNAPIYAIGRAVLSRDESLARSVSTDRLATS